MNIMRLGSSARVAPSLLKRSEQALIASCENPEQLAQVYESMATWFVGPCGAISVETQRLGMEESLFHRLMREDATSTLQLQYRMNQALADIANKVAYNDRLKCADEKVAQAKLNVKSQFSDSPWLQAVCSTDSENAALFIDMASATLPGGQVMKSLANEDEGYVVLALVEALKECQTVS
ncbi:DNA2-like helicase [Operophtera brumata]|uniref:DNA2-like helicase n=1 Tax=Operophtera brumata TaxID=104452 RepID=A0A0L7LTT8_OPEBR|nr:DNA2-like helicase [Operophtera brumata]